VTIVAMKTLHLVAALSLTACGTTVAPLPDAAVAADAVDASPEAAADAAGLCVPDRARWNDAVRARVVTHCATCHGATPAFGAPYALLDYDALVAGPAGLRRVDAMAQQLAMGAMPPPGTPAPPDAVANEIAQWASCGARAAAPATRPQSTRPWVRAPERAPAGLAAWDLRADRYPVAPDVSDRYQCFTFTVPGDGPRFIRRREMLFDRREVIHHIVLLRDAARTAPSAPFECNSMPEGSQYLYAWAPGQDAFEFPDGGGLRMTPGERYVLQLHYNNGARAPGVVDSSGVRLYHGPPTGTEYGMVAIGPLGFSLPARSVTSAASGCTFREPTRLYAGGPHMHVLGSSFLQQVVRAGGAREDLIGIERWDFNYQFSYDLGGTLIAPGDRIETRCTWNNTTPRTVSNGPRTSDEMCFNFAYVTPPAPALYCDEPLRAPGEVPYTPGRCAPPASSTDLPTVTGRMVVTAAPAPTGGAIPDGRWTLAGITWHIDTATTSFGAIDVNETAIVGRGQVWTEAGRIVADLANRLSLELASGVRFDRDIPISTAGTYTGTEGTRAFTQTCPGGGASQVMVSLDGDRLTLGFDPTSFAGITVTPRYVFQRAP
jgi:hypothetical protein